VVLVKAAKMAEQIVDVNSNIGKQWGGRGGSDDSSIDDWMSPN